MNATRWQTGRIARVPENNDSTSLGRILLGLGAVTKDQLHDALGTQALSTDGQKLGDLLCSRGVCEKRHIDRAIEIQGQMRSGQVGMASLSFLDAATEEMSINARTISSLITRRNKNAAARVEAAKSTRLLQSKISG